MWSFFRGKEKSRVLTLHPNDDDSTHNQTLKSSHTTIRNSRRGIARISCICRTTERVAPLAKEAGHRLDAPLSLAPFPWRSGKGRVIFAVGVAATSTITGAFTVSVSATPP